MIRDNEMNQEQTQPVKSPLKGDEGLTTADLAGAAPPERRLGEPRSFAAEASSTEVVAEKTAPLFAASEASDLRQQWVAIQAGFVDEPRKAVEQADGLVATAMKRLAEMFAEERGQLEGQWDRGDDVSTEDLRLALQRYRSFFGRLLSV